MAKILVEWTPEKSEIAQHSYSRSSTYPLLGCHSNLLKKREIFFQIPVAGDQPLAMRRIWVLIKSACRSRP